MMANTQSRRGFLKTAAWSTLGGALPGRTVFGADPRPPNVIFIYSDDQRFDTLGCVQRELGDRARFPFLKTPHLDRLAARGMRFRNCFVTDSLCSPSRACFMTGLYNHLNGVTDNVTEFPDGGVTIATELGKAGWITGCFGKWHMAKQRGKRYGFHHSASFIGQGAYVDVPFEIDGVEVPTKGYVDDITTDYANAFITRHRDRPFYLQIGYKSPHGPRTAREGEKGLYQGETYVPLPSESLSPPGKPADGTPPKAGPLNKSQVSYFQCVTGTDALVGKILENLERLGLSDRTIVVYTSDNGLFFGEHGLGDKRYAYEESLRIPCIIADPRRPLRDAACDAMMLNIDFAPTILSLAGVPVPAHMQGHSVVPFLSGQTPAAWRRSFYYKYHLDREYKKTPVMTAVRTEDAKLIRYEGHDEWNELFDLAADPLEMKNLLGDPGNGDLRKRLEAEYARLEKRVTQPGPFF